MAMSTDVPVIDLRADAAAVACAVRRACEAHGFFYVVGHEVDEQAASRLDTLARAFFALPDAVKARYAMNHGGRAWRGWFPLGGELTSGRSDWKEGLYLGTELDTMHPRVRAGVPLHGPNLLPDDKVLPGFRGAVLDYMAQVVALGHRVMAAIAASL